MSMLSILFKRGMPANASRSCVIAEEYAYKGDAMHPQKQSKLLAVRSAPFILLQSADGKVLACSRDFRDRYTLSSLSDYKENNGS